MVEKNKNTIISVKDIYKSFITGNRYTQVLNDVDLEVDKGEFLIIFGPSGCGKSTLLHVMMGLERPDGGVVKLGGIDLWELDTEDRANIRKREIGIMYQQQNWIKSLSVQDNIAFCGQLIGMEKPEALEKANETLGIVDMEHRKLYMPSELSAGEQQKIGLSRSLMTNPKVIIADEPTGNLDVKSGQIMINLLSDLSKTGKTIIMVTHNPEYLKFANRVILMLDGEIRREIRVDDSNADSVQKEITKDIKVFIEEGSKIKDKSSNVPKPLVSTEVELNKSILKRLEYTLKFNIRFLFQSIMFMTQVLLNKVAKRINILQGIANRFDRFFTAISRKFDMNNRTKISASINTKDLTELSFRNLWIKKSRTLITIFGMAIGIGFIVFLLSLGYGLERLVIEEITRIEDMRQVDVTPTIGSSVRLDENNLTIIRKIDGVSDMMPLINVAARVEYDRASSDVVVYGVQANYISESSMTISSGTVFDDETQEVVVNTEFLTTIGSVADSVIGKELTINFVIPEIDTKDGEELDTQKKYQIVGVVEDGNPALVYVPLKTLENFNISEFSQLRVSIEKEDEIADVRRQIEVLGFGTTSVMDTVTEVETLFSYAKFVLIIVGTIALSVAILGMVNTLTVSLLERTREVGLMKTIGMKGDEIRSLFINESMIMGISGGTLGVMLGMIMGLVVSGLLSLFSLSRGGEVIIVSFLPSIIVISIIIVSSFVGYLTGLYPSSRAVKMAPLDALRYE